MATHTEIRGSIKFCALLGFTPSQTQKHITTAYRQSTVSRSLVFRWHKRFRDGRSSIEDDERSGRPKTAISKQTIDEVKGMVQSDRRLSIHEIMEGVTNDISYGSVHDILTNYLGMRRVCARWIPRLLSSEQKEKRMDLASEFLRTVQRYGEGYLANIITTDETWLHMFDPETKQESSVWKHTDSPPPKKARVTKSSSKVMFIVFFDASGVILSHAVLKGQTVTAAYFSQVIRRHFRRAVAKKRPNLTDIVLHMDNAPSHTANLTLETLRMCNINTIAHPPYSPDLAPCDFALFPRIKKELRGRHFDSLEELRLALKAAIKNMPDDYFRDVITRQWTVRMQKCIEHSGEYFEKE